MVTTPSATTVPSVLSIRCARAKLRRPRRCGEVTIREGRAELEAYWRPRFGALAPTAFGLEEITPTADGVVLDYLSHEGKPVRIAFTFAPDGKIRQTACAPASGATYQYFAGAANEDLMRADPPA